MSVDSGELRSLLLFTGVKSGAIMSPYTSLFKYIRIRDDHTWDLIRETIVDGHLRSAPPVNLNDPFDASAIVVNDASPNEIVMLLSSVPLPGNTLMPSVNFNKVKVERPDGSVLTPNEVHDQVIKTFEFALSQKGQSQRIISFSHRISSQLLWSHYADSHCGMAYHFVHKGGKNSPLGRASPVVYERQRPIILASEILGLINKTAAFDPATSALSFTKRSLLTKSIEWSYEDESRIVTNEERLEIPADELVSIIIGPKFSNENFDALSSVIASRKTPLRVFRAQLSKTDYAIEVDWSREAQKLEQ